MIPPTKILTAILLGGKSSRMGTVKWLLPLGKKAILEHILSRLKPQSHHIILNGNDSQLKNYPYTLIDDILEDFQGPLAGLLAALEYAQEQQYDWVVTCPCDTPFIPSNFIEALIKGITNTSSLCSIATSYGKHHPVCGLWSVKLIDPLRRTLFHTEKRSIGWWSNQLNPQPTYVDFSDHTQIHIDPFMNINSPEDLELAQVAYLALQA